MKTINKEFVQVSNEELISISACGGLGSIISSVTSAISGIANVADDISTTIIKNKIIAKMDEVQKGEVELGKDGQLRLKWDTTNSSTSSNLNSTIIF